jgi:hypothetical protein
MSKCMSILQCIAESLRRIHRTRELLVPQRAYTARGADPILRSGLYIIRTFTSTAEEQTYVLYWPEDTTWDDNAVSTVQRNRVTFMRYRSVSRHLLFQNNVTCVDTSPNCAINSFACFRPSIHKRLCGETRLTTRTTHHSTWRMMTRTGSSTLWSQKRMTKKKMSSLAKDLRYGLSYPMIFPVFNRRLL